MEPEEIILANMNTFVAKREREMDFKGKKQRCVLTKTNSIDLIEAFSIGRFQHHISIVDIGLGVVYVEFSNDDACCQIVRNIDRKQDMHMASLRYESFDAW